MGADLASVWAPSCEKCGPLEGLIHQRKAGKYLTIRPAVEREQADTPCRRIIMRHEPVRRRNGPHERVTLQTRPK